ncbi:MAG: hypothetical protein ABJA16_02800 [Nakamurella sp.]
MADRGVVAGAVLVLMLTGCAVASSNPDPLGPEIPVADVSAAVQHTVDAINATAGGDVAAQQAVLRRLVDPTRAEEQAACTPATITIRIDPVLGRLSPLAAHSEPTAVSDSMGNTSSSTSGTGATGSPTGDAYRLPVLLEVYTGAVRTGTDLAGLELTLREGVAHTAPLCLR